MIIALQKKKDNIVEYLLYMFNIEGMLRTMNFDMAEIEAGLIAQYDVDEAKKEEIRNWYSGIIKEMRSSDLLEKGHLEDLHEIITELNLLHSTLLTLYQDEQYIKLNEKASEAIEDLINKSGNKNIGPIEAATNGLFGLLLLRMTNKEISPATESAFTNISELLAILVHRYNEMKAGTLGLPQHQKN